MRDCVHQIGSRRSGSAFLQIHLPAIDMNLAIHSSNSSYRIDYRMRYEYYHPVSATIADRVMILVIPRDLIKEEKEEAVLAQHEGLPQRSTGHFLERWFECHEATILFPATRHSCH